MARMRIMTLVLVAGAALPAGLMAAETAKPASGNEPLLLQMVSGVKRCYGNGVVQENKGTIWRYYETWRTDVAKTADGKLVRVDPFIPRSESEKFQRGAKSIDMPIRPADRVTGSEFPPADWMKPDFDDSTWISTANPMQMCYRSLAQVCLRGKFQVNDPAAIPELTLTGSIQGGAVVYLNGQEVGRFHLPAGKIDNETLAEDYPMEAFVSAAGDPLPQAANTGDAGWAAVGGGELPFGEDEYSNSTKGKKDPALIERYKKRFRHFTLKIPGSLLRKGANVLAIEAHRAPAAGVMFSHIAPKIMGFNLTDNYTAFWNRVSVEELTLTAKAPAKAAIANVARPAGLQIWTAPVEERIANDSYGDPNAPITPIRLTGAKNGAFAGQVVVSSTEAITGLKVEASNLSGTGGASIPASSIRLRSVQGIAGGKGYAFDALEETIPTEIATPPVREPGKPAAVIQPIWITVEVPKTAVAGDYTGTVKVSANGAPPVQVPLQLHVSDWIIPNPQDFSVYMSFIQSPDTLALRYDVPMWSEAHWKLIERCFQLVGLVSTKDLNVTLVRRTHFGNEHGMVWFVKKPDGSYRPYLGILDRYIDLAAKYFGKFPVLACYVIEEDADGSPWVTEFDPATGELKDALAPPWGTPEAKACWKPVFNGIRAALARHGMEKSLALATHATSGGGPEPSKNCIADMKEIAPQAGWVKLSHTWGGHGPEKLESGPGGNPWARVSLVAGNYGVLWDIDKDTPFRGWTNPYPIIMYTRSVFTDFSPLKQYRLGPEMILFGGHRKPALGSTLCDIAGQFGSETFAGTKGFGPWGVDFWPILSAGKGGATIIGRFNSPLGGQSDPRSYWYTVSLNGSVPYLVGDGAQGPISTVRLELMRENMQEAEAHILCQNVLINSNQKARLGGELLKRCESACNTRLHALRYESEFTFFGAFKDPLFTHFVFNPSAWQKQSRDIYETAAEVAKAVGK